MQARRWSVLRIVSAWTLLVLVPAAATAQGIPARALPDDAALAKLKLVRNWHTQVPVLRLRESISTLFLHEGTMLREGRRVRDALIFVQTNSGQIHALGAETGEPRWSMSVGVAGAETYRPFVTDEAVYVASGTQLIQVDRATGRLLAARELPAFATAGPVASKEFVYVPLATKTVYAFWLRGDEWTKTPERDRRYDERHRKFNQLPIAWLYATSAEVKNTPIMLRDRLVVLSQDGVITALQADSGKVIFKSYTSAETKSPLAYLDGNLFMASSDFSLYAIDVRRTATARWRFVAGYPIAQQPAPFLDDVLAVADGAGLASLGNADGQLRWGSEKVARLVGVTKKHVYGADKLGNLLVLDRATGKELGSLPMPYFSMSAPNQFNDRLYLATADGVVLALREQDSPQPEIYPQTTARDEDVKRGKGAGEAKKQPGKKKSFDDDDKPIETKKAKAPAPKKPASAPKPKKEKAADKKK